MSKNNGGAAFPNDWMDFQPHTGAQIIREHEPGMSLRDYFAANAPEGEVADIVPRAGGDVIRFLGLPEGEVFVWRTHHVQAVAKARYMLADAMLEARKV